jgi:hypothetical protein
MPQELLIFERVTSTLYSFAFALMLDGERILFIGSKTTMGGSQTVRKRKISSITTYYRSRRKEPLEPQISIGLTYRCRIVISPT